MGFRERLIHVHHCRGSGWKAIERLLKKDHDLRHLYHLSIKDLICDFHFKKHHAEAFHEDLHKIDIHTQLEQYDKRKIKVITIDDPRYPKLLKEIFDPPWVIYAKGNVNLLNDGPTLGVVGTRRPTHIAYKNMRQVLTPLLELNWVIVSGLAIGIDGYAHKMALNGKTIAVLGSGLTHPYPSCHWHLFNQIAEKHLVLSEYPPHTPPNKWQFPERNRIISGLSLGVLVVEAKQKSGSLITADQAMEQGREVFAIPGPIFEPNYVGTHALIQQGAKLVTCSDDIISEIK
ncbi:MAG: DNA-processing protein DprA [Tuberibacillus sp.]